MSILDQIHTEEKSGINGSHLIGKITVGIKSRAPDFYNKALDKHVIKTMKQEILNYLIKNCIEDMDKKTIGNYYLFPDMKRNKKLIIIHPAQYTKERKKRVKK